jgi:hypothetical protein
MSKPRTRRKYGEKKTYPRVGKRTLKNDLELEIYKKLKAARS